MEACLLKRSVFRQATALRTGRFRQAAPQGLGGLGGWSPPGLPFKTSCISRGTELAAVTSQACSKAKNSSAPTCYALACGPLAAIVTSTAQQAYHQVLQKCPPRTMAYLEGQKCSCLHQSAASHRIDPGSCAVTTGLLGLQPSVLLRRKTSLP